MSRVVRALVLAAILVLTVAVPVASAAHAAGPAPSHTGSLDATQSPADQTPYGIETIYRNEDLTETVGGAGVDVAVLDTGVDRRHPDLRDRVELCRDYTGESVTYGRCADANGHGTHVAGTVLADGGPAGEGIYGVAPAADLYAFKVCTDDGVCPSSAMRAAIRGAADAGAEVIVMSLGGERDPFVQSAVQYAHEQGALLVAATGNSGPDLGTINYPAADRLVVGVGAVQPRTSDGGLTPENYAVPAFSSRGIGTDSFSESDGVVELSAPGAGILSTVPGGGYTARSGTSFAAPHVGGLAAKLWFETPDTDGDGQRNDDVRERLRDLADGFDIVDGEFARPGYDPAAGVGVPTTPSPTAAIAGPSESRLVGDTVRFTAGGSEPADSSIVGYEWDFDGDGETDATGRTVETTFESPGRYQVRVTVRDADGNAATETRRLLVNDRPQVTVTVPSSVRAGREATLVADVTDEFGATNVTWRFPDGSTATGERVDRTFEAGTHPVTVVVTDEYGARTEVTIQVQVAPAGDTDTPRDDDGSESGDSVLVPGFGPVLALSSVVLATLVVRRRR